MQKKIERFYYLDSMRCVLMILGVVLHSAQVFNPQKTWLITSQNSSELAYVIVQVIHTFRMPAFFVLSGLFCMITLQKYQFKRFVVIRFNRIVIPIIAVALTFNLMQALVLSYVGSNSFSPYHFFFNGGWVSHLWFLLNLTVYLTLTAILYRTINSRAKYYMTNLLWTLDKLPLYVIVIFLPFFSIFILALNKIGFPLYGQFLGIIDVYSLLKYSPYFLFGLILGFRLDLLRRFSQSKLYVNLLLLCCCIAGLNNVEKFVGFYPIIVDAYLRDFIVWMSIVLIFNVFFRFFNQSSITWKFLSEASYSIYLFHHFFVVLIGLILIYFGIPNLLGMAIIIIATTILSLLLHKYLVCKVKVLRFMFNGK